MKNAGALAAEVRGPKPGDKRQDRSPKSNTKPACASCGDVGYSRQIKEGYGVIKRCPCQKKRWVEIELRRSGIPPKYWNSSLFPGTSRGEFTRWGSQPDRKAQQLALIYARETYTQLKEFFISGGEATGLVLQGQPGRGKTRLACSIAIDLAWDGLKEFHFADCSEIIPSISEAIATGGHGGDVLGPLERARLLILDDANLGGPDATNALRRRISQLLRQRYNAGKPTIITTNDLGRDFDRNFGPQLASRLHEFCSFCQVGGPDYRRRSNSKTDELEV